MLVRTVWSEQAAFRGRCFLCPEAPEQRNEGIACVLKGAFQPGGLLPVTVIGSLAHTPKAGPET